jgi:hypothetical protein
MKIKAAVLLLLVASQGLAEMKTYPSKTVKISAYKTYTWLAPRLFTATEINDHDPVFTPIIRAAVNKQMAERGYKEVAEGGQIQLIVAAVVTISSQLEAYLVQFGFGVDDYYNTIGVVAATPITRINREGVLAIGFYDPKLKQSLWSGYITKALGKPQKDPTGLIDGATSKLLKDLPKSE